MKRDYSMQKWIVFFSVLLMFSAAPQSPAAAASSGPSILAFWPNALVKADGTYWVWGGSRSVPTQIHGLDHAAVSFDRRLVMKQDKTVWYWEGNSPSEIRVRQVEKLNNLVDVLFAGRTLAALDADGNVHTVQWTESGLDMSRFAPLAGIDQVADMTSYYEFRPKSGKQRWIFLKKDGTVWSSSNELTSFTPVASLADIVAVERNFALKADGTVWTWPDEVAEEAPDSLTAVPFKGLTDIRTIKTDGYTHLAIDGKSRLWFWGSTLTGYSDGTQRHEHTAPIRLTSIQNVKDAFVVERSLVVLTNDGNVYETSINRERMPEHPVFELLASDVAQIKADVRHFIMQKNDGTLWGWGVNKDAQLGNGDYEFMHTTPVPVQEPIEVRLNGGSVALSSGVVTRNGQAFIPLRSVFEKLGAKVEWDGTNKVATISRSEGGAPSVEITVNTKTGETKLNGNAVQMANAPFGINGTSYLPLRFISESLGAKVDWLQPEGVIAITMD